MKTGIGLFFFNNILYLVWFSIYFSLAWLILGATLQSFYIVLIVYGVSILIALSPIGEEIFRKIENIRKIETREEKDYLLPIFEEVLIEAKKEAPYLSNNIQLYITDNLFINAFAIGSSTIAVTKGAVAALSADELKGVIAHEFGHIVNGDTKALLLNVVGNGIFTLIILGIRIMLFIFRFFTIGDRSGTAQPIMSIFKFIFEACIFVFMSIGQLILAINDRQNEFKADEFALKIRFGSDLIDALYILQKTTMPTSLSMIEKAKMSHPHIAKRIANLETKLEQMEQMEQ